MASKTTFAAAFGLALVGFSGATFAQSQTNDEVKKAVERAVGASIASSVTESLSRSVVSDRADTPTPNTTVFTSPFYNRLDASFGFGSFKADTGGANLGVLQKVSDIILLHGVFAGSFTHTNVGAGSLGGTSGDSGLLNGIGGADFIFLNNPDVKAWVTLEGGLSYFTTDNADSWGWQFSPSVTFSLPVNGIVSGGPILFEPNIGFGFANTLDGDNTPTVSVLNLGGSVKYRGEKFRPQFNLRYTDIMHPEHNDSGFISFGPELLYAWRPNLLVGGSYTYGTTFDKGVDLNSHTVTVEARWTF